MEEFRISNEVNEQIKDFSYVRPTEEQELLVDKLILNEEIKERYKKFGLCKGCKQPKSYVDWCRPCSSERFKQDFNNWTSGNPVVDKFIQQKQLKADSDAEVVEWIEYNVFKNVEYLAKGGFGTVYKALWGEQGPLLMWNYESNHWMRSKDRNVVLKCLHNSQDNIAEFLREVELHIIANSHGSSRVSRCYGISRNPETNEYMMIMDCARNGGLRQYLDENFSSLRWDQKFNILSSIALGLSNIHKRGLIHRDFHIGNMIVDFNQLTYVTDLGLCRPMNVQNNDVYGVLPYVAPEILRGKECTQKSDIYGFGIIAYETCTGLPPYHDIAHDRTLAIQICQGLRPKSDYKIPQLILDIIYQCWDDDPLKRPDAEELFSLFNEYEREIVYLDYDPAQLPMNNPALPPPPPYVRVVTEICTQTKEVDEINKDLPAISSNITLQSNSNALSYSTHPQAVYKSKLLDFADLPESNLIDLNID